MAFRRSGPPSPRLLGSHRALNTMARPLAPPARERKSACGFGDAASVKKRDLGRKIRWYAPLSSCYGGPDRALSTGKTLLLYLCFDDSNLAWWVHHFAAPRAAVRACCWLRRRAQSIGDSGRAQPCGSIPLRTCGSNLAWCHHFGTANNLRHTAAAPVSSNSAPAAACH